MLVTQRVYNYSAVSNALSIRNSDGDPIQRINSGKHEDNTVKPSVLSLKNLRLQKIKYICTTIPLRNIFSMSKT